MIPTIASHATRLAPMVAVHRVPYWHLMVTLACIALPKLAAFMTTVTVVRLTNVPATWSSMLT